MPGSWTVGGAAALQQHAPTVAVTLTGLVSAWPDSVGEAEMAAIRVVTAEGLGLPPLRPPPTGPRSAPLPPPTREMVFAEQLAVDVSAITAAQRAAWVALHGGVAQAAGAVDATLAAWVSESLPRLRAALDALFGADAWYDPAPQRTPYTRVVRDELRREVALLDELDPVTTELVRLRVARHHGCRVALSRRSVAALAAGTDKTTFEAVDHYRDSDLSAAQQAALALADAITWTPADLRARDVDAVRRHLTPAQAVEVVLDVTACSADKVDVALGTDVPDPDDPVLFEVDERGELRLR
ncbi:carboxymuconolactone decarboxylase family protein [Nocardioides rubriscoriae]|uniref:carboxymuconolactone decarboxylase family protein n=1 Tax=Nocardioides rubriscoriae TaxID=642762 RepID=UPI0011E0319E|nr:carboxymuconolactone decarboxylase family protein [Nocardioides rubriscoriae]